MCELTLAWTDRNVRSCIMSTRYLLILPMLHMLIDIALSTDAKVWRHLSENKDCNDLFFMVRDLSGAPILPELSPGIYKRVNTNSWECDEIEMLLQLRFEDVRLKPVAGGVKTDLTVDFIDQTLRTQKENWKLDTVWEQDRLSETSIYVFRQHNTDSEDKFLSVVVYGHVTVNDFLEMQESQQKLEEQLQICYQDKEAADRDQIMLAAYASQIEILKEQNARLEQEVHQRANKQQELHATNTDLMSELAAKDADLRSKDREVKQLRDKLATKARDDEEREQRHVEEAARAEESVAQQRREREAVERTLRDERKESGMIWGIASCTVGAVLLVIGYFVVAMRWRAEEEHEEEMEGELIAQSQMFKRPHPLVPAVPSAHAGRLGVHENPAVRDVFGMPKHWDVTPGEGFHVSRMTSDGSTPGTTRGTRKSSVVLDVKEGDMEGAQGLSKVSEHGTDGADMELSEENVVAEGGEQLDL